jgi:TP901 family phage tail tape measure protein
MALGGALAQAFVRLRVDSSLVAADTAKGVEEGAAEADVETAGAGAGERAASAFNKAFRVGMIGVLAAAAIGAVAIKSAVDFQTQMTKIQTQAGASATQVKQLSAAVLQLAPSTQQGPQQLAAALYHLKSVGMDDADAMKALKTASDLAAVGGANLEQTTNVLAGAWRSGIQGAQNFGQAAATVNAIVGAGNMTMSGLVSALSTGVLTAARTFGVSMSEVGSAMALMTDSGVPAARAGTELRMSLSLLGAPSTTAAAQLAKIGLSSTALASALRSGGLIGAIGLLRQHIKGAGLDAVQTAQLLSRAFGGGESSAAIMLMVNDFDVLKNKQAQVDAGMSKYGADVAAQRQTIQAQLDILRSSLETAGIRIGDALLKPFVNLTHFVAADLVPGILAVGNVLGKVFSNPWAQAFLGSLIAAAVAIKGIIVATKLWAAAMALVDAATAASGIGLIIVAVAALAAGIAILYMRSKTFRDIVQGAFHGVEAAVKAVIKVVAGLVDAVTGAFDDIKQVITGGFDAWWKSHGQEIEQVWDSIWGPVVAVTRAAWDLISGVFRIYLGLIETEVKAGWDVIATVVKVAWDLIAGVVKIDIAAIEAMIKIAWDVIVGIFNVALDLLTGQWGKAWDDMRTTVTQVWNAIKSFLGSALSAVEGMFVSAWNNVVSGVKSMASDVLGFFKALPGEIVAALGDVGHLLWNAGVSIIKGLIGGIKSALGGLGSVMSDAAGFVKSFLPFSPAKQGPLSGSGDPYYSGLSIGKKIAQGITASLPALKSALTGTVGEINSALSKAATEQGSGTSQLSALTGHADQLQALRTKEENQIKQLIAARQQELAQDKTGSAALRKSQEDEIKELQKLRTSQESQVKQTDSVISTLKKSMTSLKDEVDKLKTSLAKATTAAAAAASSSSSSSSTTSTSTSSSSASQPADFANLNQWLAETAPNPADAGSWQGNPGPLGGFGLAFDQGGGPRPVGGYDGGGPFGQGGSELLAALLAEKLDEVIGTLRAQPAKNAAGMAAAMNGVTQTAITRGNW